MSTLNGAGLFMGITLVLILTTAGFLIWLGVRVGKKLRLRTNAQKHHRMTKEECLVENASTDQRIELAISGSDPLAMAALKKICDRAALEKIAQKAEDESIIHSAKRRICTLYGHDRDGCHCRRCGAEKEAWHDWEIIEVFTETVWPDCAHCNNRARGVEDLTGGFCYEPYINTDCARTEEKTRKHCRLCGKEMVEGTQC